MILIITLLSFRDDDIRMEDEFQLDDGIISGSFDDAFDMGMVGTGTGTIWYICWKTDRSKTSLLTSHRDQITGLISLEDEQIGTCSEDGSIRIFQLEDRSEVLRIQVAKVVSVYVARL